MSPRRHLPAKVVGRQEVEELNRIVAMYLDCAEDQARRRQPVTMAEMGR
jgi:hypothetical protein